MKRYYVVMSMLVGMFMSLSAYACNWDRQNCGDVILKDVPQQLTDLYRNPQFMQKYGNEVQYKVQNIDNRIKNCGTQRACNQAYGDFAGWVYIQHQNYVKNPQRNNQQQVQLAQAPKTADKWTDQCVIGKANVINTYSDESGSTRIGVLPDTAFNVTKTNGGQLVGLTNAENKKFVGWVKKSDLQMQELRNCNMF